MTKRRDSSKRLRRMAGGSRSANTSSRARDSQVAPGSKELAAADRDRAASASSDGSPTGWRLIDALRPVAACGVALMIVWSFLEPQDATSVFQGNALAQNLFWLLVAGLSSAAVAFSGGVRFGKWAWVVPVLALVWLVLVSLHAGLDNNPRRSWNGFWQVVSLAAAFYCVRAISCGPRSRSVVVSICLAGFIATAFHGMYQAQIGIPAARERYLADPEGVLASAGIQAPAGSPARARFEDRLLKSDEVYATYALANSLGTALSAGVLILASTLAFGLLLRRELSQGAAGSEIGWVAYSALCIALFAVLVSWFLTRSRSAYVAVAISGIIGVLLVMRGDSRLRPTFRQLVTGVGVVLLVASAGVLWLIRNDSLVLTEAWMSFEYRWEYWISCVRLIGDHWLWGVGLGNFQSYYPLYKLPMASEEIADPHNWVLDMAASLSLVFAALVVCWLASVLFALCRRGSHGAGNESTSKQAALDRRCSRGLALGAGLGGVLCLFFLWMLTGMDSFVALITWVVAGALVVGFYPLFWFVWIRQPSFVVAAAIAMLICLLASGSWQASGIAVPLLALLAASDRTDGVLGPPNRWAMALPLCGLAIFIMQAWMPATRGWAAQQSALRAPNQTEQMRLLQAAAEADRLDAQVQGWVAQGRVAEATQAGRAEFPPAAAASLQAVDDWLERDGINFSNWRMAGDMALDLTATARRLGLPMEVYLERATDYYQNAVQRYPTSVLLRAQLGATASLGGEYELAEQQFSKAIELSEQTPHTDKKLWNQLVYLPFVRLPDHVQSQTKGMAMAEPLIEWIRTQQVTPGVADGDH